jgi:hypothetical protein
MVHFTVLGQDILMETDGDAYSDAQLRWAWLGLIASRYVVGAIHAAVALLIGVPVLFTKGVAIASEPVISL